MISFKWIKSEYEWKKKIRRVDLALSHQYKEWDLEHKDIQYIKDKVSRILHDKMAASIADDIRFEYSDEIKKMIAGEMLEDKDIKKLIKEAFVKQAGQFLYLGDNRY